MKYGVLNLFALLIVLLLASGNYEVWTHPPGDMPEKGAAGKFGAKIDNPPLSGSQQEPTSIQSYISIAEKNIFSPERKEFSPQASPSPEVKKPTVRPQIVLYGVMIADEYQRASIVNPGRSLYQGERETKSLTVGQRIGEYTLAKILPDRILMEAAGDSFEVLLYDPKMPKQRMEAKTEIRPAVPSGAQLAGPPATPRSPAPAPPPPSAEARKPAGPVQENLAAPSPAAKPATPSSRSRGVRRVGRMQPSPAEPPAQGAPAN